MELPPPTTYIQRRGKGFAYQAFGKGPRALVICLEVNVHPDLLWTDPIWTDGCAQAAEMSRVVIFQQAGLGLSEAIDRVPTLEEHASDIVAVMDEEGISSAVLFGTSWAAMGVALVAAQFPERVDALVLSVPMAQGWRHSSVGGIDGLAAGEADALAAVGKEVADSWGEGRTIELWDPVLAPRNRRVAAMLERSSASPAVAAAVYEAAMVADVRDVLPLVRAPTTVLRHASCGIPEGQPRLVADLIDGAIFHELPASHPRMSLGESYLPMLDHVLGVMAGKPQSVSDDRRLATILFTDVVSSTEFVVEHGDADWRALLDRHEDQIREHVEGAGGRLVKMIGDGSMSVFPGPAAAIRAAQRVRDDARALEIEVRAGVHTGECDRRAGGDISGLAVHIAARVGSAAGPGEVWVSRTVHDLVGGAGLQLTSKGVHTLKGVAQPWELFALDGEDLDATRVEQQPSLMRVSDRLAVATARRAPGLLRGLNRMDNARRRGFRRAD